MCVCVVVVVVVVVVDSLRPVQSYLLLLAEFVYCSVHTVLQCELRTQQSKDSDNYSFRYHKTKQKTHPIVLLFLPR